jgi:hypothetical protein
LWFLILRRLRFDGRLKAFVGIPQPNSDVGRIPATICRGVDVAAVVLAIYPDRVDEESIVLDLVVQRFAVTGVDERGGRHHLAECFEGRRPTAIFPAIPLGRQCHRCAAQPREDSSVGLLELVKGRKEQGNRVFWETPVAEPSEELCLRLGPQVGRHFGDFQLSSHQWEELWMSIADRVTIIESEPTLFPRRRIAPCLPHCHYTVLQAIQSCVQARPLATHKDFQPWEFSLLLQKPLKGEKILRPGLPVSEQPVDSPAADGDAGDADELYNGEGVVTH